MFVSAQARRARCWRRQSRRQQRGKVQSSLCVSSWLATFQGSRAGRRSEASPNLGIWGGRRTGWAGKWRRVSLRQVYSRRNALISPLGWGWSDVRIVGGGGAGGQLTMSRLLRLNPRRLSRWVRCAPTLHGRSHGVEDLEGRADVGTDAGDVLLLAAHVAVLGAAGLRRQEEAGA